MVRDQGPGLGFRSFSGSGSRFRVQFLEVAPGVPSKNIHVNIVLDRCKETEKHVLIFQIYF